MTIVVTPKRTGVITNTASIGSDAAEADPSDNTATSTTTVAR